MYENEKSIFRLNFYFILNSNLCFERTTCIVRLVCDIQYFFFFLRTKTRCLEENEEKHGRKENSERKRKKENKREALRASLNYAEELGPLLFLGRRSETGAGWLSDAGEY